MNTNTKSSSLNQPVLPSSPSLAIATIPMQAWEQPYEPCKALETGTIFPCLDLPFFVTGGGCRG